MQKLLEKERQRPELRTISMSSDIWSKAKELSREEGWSVSFFFREMVKRLYRKKSVNKQKSEKGDIGIEN